jgi:uncharacterized protein (DUF885 family)
MIRFRLSVAAALGAIAAIGFAVDAMATDAPPGDAWRTQVEATGDIETLAKLYLQLMVAVNPVQGTQLGIHGTVDDPNHYDDALPDVSAQSAALYHDQLAFLRDRLARLDAATLSRADQIDHHVLVNQVQLDLLQLTELGQMTDPLAYASIVGDAYSTLVLRDYAPLEQRLSSFGSRCAQTPRLLADARANLLPPYVRPTAVQKQLAPGRLRATTAEDGLLRKTLPELLTRSKLTAAQADDIRNACSRAVATIDEFATWFESAMASRPDGEWRLGRELYAKKYALVMDYPLGPDELLAEAERALDTQYAALVAVARRLHDRYLRDAIRRGDEQPEGSLDDAQVARAVLAKLSEDRSTVDTLIPDSYALADSIVAFVKKHRLMDLPPTSKLRIENVPPHLSGYAVAQIQTAPVFEPQLESVWFWDLPLLAQSESYLKEYNRAVLAEVYIHEGVPGHFVQLDYSNRFPRLVPRLFTNGPMVEGWAAYIQTQLVDEGYTVYPRDPLGHDLQKIADLKLQLRSILNAIIDVRLQTTDWPEEDAVRLMMERGFQEEGEARGKLTRAKLSSVQLATYFAGHHAILEILGEYRRAKGDAFTWKDFNERLVGGGSPPFFALRELMLGQ